MVGCGGVNACLVCGIGVGGGVDLQPMRKNVMDSIPQAESAKGAVLYQHGAEPHVVAPKMLEG